MSLLRRFYCHTCGTEQRVEQYLELTQPKRTFWNSLARTINSALNGLVSSPQPSYAGSIENDSSFNPQTYSARSATLDAPAQKPRPSQKPLVKHDPPKERPTFLSAEEFRKLSHEQQDETIDFVRFRYQARATNPFLENTPLETLITNLSRNLEVPIGNNHKYLSRDLIEKIIL